MRQMRGNLDPRRSRNPRKRSLNKREQRLTIRQIIPPWIRLLNNLRVKRKLNKQQNRKDSQKKRRWMKTGRMLISMTEPINLQRKS